LAVIAACSAAALTSSPAERPPAPVAVRREIGEEAIRREPWWDAKARRDFPGDLWSQGDAFHFAEAKFAREMSDRHDVRMSDVIDAIDESVRASAVPWRRVTASPCKPRPFYD
jgi:hypothetical protein